MNQSFDLDCLIGTIPQKQRKNGRFVKGMTPHNKGKKWCEWMDGRKQRKVRKCLIHTGNPILPGWNKKQVVGISIDGKACVFESSKDVERKLGIESRNVRGCCEGKRNLAGGLFFMWAENWNGTTQLTDEQKKKYEIAMKRKETKWKKTESAH
jgi:hypothetical protein